jgi:hypothetical protein
MSAILDSLRRRPDFERGDFAGTRRNTDYTSTSGVGLREIARQQGEALRDAFASKSPATPRAARAAEVRQRVETHRANVQADGARRATAREMYAQIDAALRDIPTGFYALPKREEATNGNRPFYFFKVHPFRGGKRIIMVTGGVGAFTEVPMKALWQLRAAQGISRDLAGAAALFGKETSTCGFCAAKGRRSPLTHPRSVAAGYGKDCAELHGLPW